MEKSVNDIKIFVSDNAYVPKKATVGSSGFDLRSIELCVLNPKSWEKIKTGIKIAIPEGMEAKIRPRSGLAYKFGITVLNSEGTIDSDYRGELSVILINHSSVSYTVFPGDKIAQLVFNFVPKVKFIEVKESELSHTERGIGGFGSTGV